MPRPQETREKNEEFEMEMAKFGVGRGPGYPVVAQHPMNGGLFARAPPSQHLLASRNSREELTLR